MLEPAWGELANGLACAGTVDEVIALHAAFLDDCLERTLLTGAPGLLKTLTKLVTLCALFSEQLTRATEDHR